MVFRLARPAEAEIARVLESQRNAPVTYRTLQGMQVDRNSVQLGTGDAVFQAARAALQSWKMMDLGWLRAFPSGDEAAVVIHHFGFWSINVSRVLGREETQTSYSFRYGTLPHHAECGEERFAVTLRDDGSVWYEIVAHSRPRHPLAKLAYPLTRKLQKRFARDSMARMRCAAAATAE